jgi:hypothetical protein
VSLAIDVLPDLIEISPPEPPVDPAASIAVARLAKMVATLHVLVAKRTGDTTPVGEIVGHAFTIAQAAADTGCQEDVARDTHHRLERELYEQQLCNLVHLQEQDEQLQREADGKPRLSAEQPTQRRGGHIAWAQNQLRRNTPEETERLATRFRERARGFMYAASLRGTRPRTRLMAIIIRARVATWLARARQSRRQRNAGRTARSSSGRKRLRPRSKGGDGPPDLDPEQPEPTPTCATSVACAGSRSASARRSTDRPITRASPVLTPRVGLSHVCTAPGPVRPSSHQARSHNELRNSISHPAPHRVADLFRV